MTKFYGNFVTYFTNYGSLPYNQAKVRIWKYGQLSRRRLELTSLQATAISLDPLSGTRYIFMVSNSCKSLPTACNTASSPVTTTRSNFLQRWTDHSI